MGSHSQVLGATQAMGRGEAHSKSGLVFDARDGSLILYSKRDVI